MDDKTYWEKQVVYWQECKLAFEKCEGFGYKLNQNEYNYILLKLERAEENFKDCSK